jgi:hypothetical protein
MLGVTTAYARRAAAALAAGLVLAGAANAQTSVVEAAGSAPAEVTVVELFTAQGCAACPQANAAVADLTERPGVLVLTYSVDYWDYLGWPDTFARPDFTARQRAYQQRLGLRDVYTPQVIIDGHDQISGARTDDMLALVDTAVSQRRYPPEIEFREDGRGVGIGSGRAPQEGAEVWLVRYQPGAQLVQVRGGENRGQVIPHANVVRSLESLGEWRGRPILLPLPDGRDDLGVAILVQSRADGAVLAAAVR